MALDRQRSSRKSGRHPHHHPRSGPGGAHPHPSSARGGQRGQSPSDRTPPSTAAKCKDYCRKFLAFLFSHVGLCALVVGYAIGGALVFQHIEAPHEDMEQMVIKQEVDVLRNQTLNDLWNITTALNVFNKKSWSNFTQLRLSAYQKEFVRRIKDDGYDAAPDSSKWTFSGAFLFSLTVITTIGYGNIAPRTDEGKILTIVYAIFGIPLMLLYLTNIGGILAKSFRFVYGRFCSCRPAPSAQEKRAAMLRTRSVRLKSQRSRNAALGLPTAGPSSSLPNTPLGTLNRPSNRAGPALIDPSTSHDTRQGRSLTDPSYVGEEGSDSETELDGFDEKTPKNVEKVHVPISLSLMILITYVSGGGALFSIWEEDWGYLEGSYFCFISLSTIGFGDLVPGAAVATDEGGSQERMVICSLYLLAGLALIAMCFNLMQEEVIHKVRNFGKRIGIIKDPEDEDELDVP